MTPDEAVEEFWHSRMETRSVWQKDKRVQVTTVSYTKETARNASPPGKGELAHRGGEKFKGNLVDSCESTNAGEFFFNRVRTPMSCCQGTYFLA